jgi:hypothetical protein
MNRYKVVFSLAFEEDRTEKLYTYSTFESMCNLAIEHLYNVLFVAPNRNASATVIESMFNTTDTMPTINGLKPSALLFAALLNSVDDVVWNNIRYYSEVEQEL